MRRSGTFGILEIRYEHLIADPERTLRDVCAFVDLAFDPRMLRYHETARQRLDEVTTWVGPDGSVIVTKEQHLENQRFTSLPPVAERVGRWRREMTSDEQAEFESVAGVPTGGARLPIALRRARGSSRVAAVIRSILSASVERAGWLTHL